MTALAEAAIRADERAKVEREIVAWLRSNPWFLLSVGDPGTGPFTRDDQVVAEVRSHDADAIECGKYRGGER